MKKWILPRSYKKDFEIEITHLDEVYTAIITPLLTYSVEGIPQFFYVNSRIIKGTIYKFSSGWVMKKADAPLVKQIGKALEKTYIKKITDARNKTKK